MPFWYSFITGLTFRYTELSSISEDKGFISACRNFIYDLHSFTKPQSRNRLESTGHEYYLGKPYFKPAQVQKILEMPVMNGTVESKLRELTRKRLLLAIQSAPLTT